MNTKPLQINTKKQRDFTAGAMFPQIIAFTVPLIITAVLQKLFNTADTIVVGRFGGETLAEREAALAAVGSCGALMMLLVNLFIGMSVGSGVCVAHAVGEGRQDKIEKTIHTALFVASIAGVIVTVLGIFLARPLLILMGTEQAVLDEAVPYMIAVFCGMPANMVYNYAASMLRSTGNTVYPLAFLTVSGVANVILNLIMVLCFGMGALGVGIATAAAHWISCALIIIYMLRTSGPCRWEPKRFAIDKKQLKKILRIGIPQGLQSSLFSLSNVIIQSTVNSFGITAVAGNTAAANLGDYIYLCQNAFSQAALTFAGQNIGAKKFARVRKSVNLCVVSVTVIGVLVGGISFLFGRPLLRIFSPDNEPAVAVGMVRLSVLCFGYFLCGVMDIFGCTLRAFGKSFSSMIICLIGSCLLRIAWIYTVFPLFGTLEWVYLSYPVSWLLTGAVLFVFYRHVIKKEEYKLKMQS